MWIFLFLSRSKVKRRRIMASCETCQYAQIDEFTGEAFCDLDLDEDEALRLSQRRSKECPFYKDGDEYKTVRHQM